MTGQRWLMAGIAVILLAGSGCMTCGYRNYGLARDSAPECELPCCQRNQVYVFAMSGLNPVSIMAVDALREELSRKGFPKVATGQTIHAWWMAREMRRIRDAEPDAVFIVVGFESAAPVAVRLAEKAQADGLPISGVVVIDSEGRTPPPATSIRTLAVGNVQGMPSSETVESVVVPDVASYGLASDARTVGAMTRLLTDAAAATPIPVAVESTEWNYPHAPPMRPIGEPVRHPDWMFLFDQQPVTRRSVNVVPTAATQAVPAPTRSAIR
jgi:hypothetical protein